MSPAPPGALGSSLHRPDLRGRRHMAASAAGIGPVRIATAIDPQRRSLTSSTLSAGAFTLCGRPTAYGRRVTGAMEDRAAVFTSQPQAVEVHRAGVWWAGELLGWRHDASGSCQVWVRVALGGVEETLWTDLTSLRLPERRLGAATERAVRGANGPGTQEMSVARHPSGRRGRVAGADRSAPPGPSMIPDLSVVPDLPASGGRRTSDQTAEFASVGRRRAPETVEAPATGGRRTADETARFASVGRRRAPEDAPIRQLPAVPSGRHRATDAGQPAAAPEPATSIVGAAAGTVPSGPVVTRAAGRPQEPGPPSAATGWTPPVGLEPEHLTRPMRLSDHVPQARRPRVERALRDV